MYHKIILNNNRLFQQKSSKYSIFTLIITFLGGCLFTVTIITVGLFIWKMYEARIERSYLTI